MARGDFGVAFSLVSAIPGVGSFVGVGMKAVKAGIKAAKAMSKISKITKKVEEFYNALNSIASIVRIYKEREFYLQLGKDMLKGEFDITAPKDASRLIKVAHIAAPS